MILQCAFIIISHYLIIIEETVIITIYLPNKVVDIPSTLFKMISKKITQYIIILIE